MLKFVGILCICFTAFLAFGQSTSKWQIGTIAEVRFIRVLRRSAVPRPPAMTCLSKWKTRFM
jgi:hypothetical protein